MERRNFLELSVLSALSLGTRSLRQEVPGKGFKVEAGKDHYAGELLTMGGRFDCKVSARDTGGELCIYDTIRHEKGGPPLHLHHSQDEWFYVIKGEFIVRVGEATFNLKSGDSAFGPRKIPHAFANISEGEAQMLVLFQPAGNIEDFFLQMSKIGKEIQKNQEVVLKELFEQHGMEIKGPPLAI